MPVKFDKRTGRYRNESGRFISRADVLRMVEEETARGQVRLRAIARLLVSKRIDVPEFQARMAQQIKSSHIRLGLLGAGGKDAMTSQHYGQIGRGLRDEFSYLRNFGEAIAAGELTESQIMRRAELYSMSARLSFFAVEKQARQRAGVRLAKRDLDPQARHCDDCLKHSTNGRWVPISEIVPVGSRCRCRNKCRCSIFYQGLAA